MNKNMLEKLKNELLLENNLELDIEKIIEQVQIFEKGIAYLKLARPCVIGDGIKVILGIEENEYLNHFKSALDEGRIIKFVPASGAASRMFKNLLSVSMKNKHTNIKTLKEKASRGDDESAAVVEFYENLPRFAFYEDIKNAVIKSGSRLEDLITEGIISDIINYVTNEKGLNYSNLPKGSIPFHLYPDGARTAFEEHLVEAMNYSAGKDKTIRAHFTISPEHELIIEMLFQSLYEKYKKEGWKFEVGFSFQSPSTKTVSVNSDNSLFRDEKGNITFRPGGHGALLKNLEELKADLILIKNIDNISPDHLKSETYKYKMILGGYLISLQKKIFSFLEKCTEEKSNENFIEEIIEFIKKEIGYQLTPEFNSMNVTEKKKYLFNFLNRPIRICGMVKKEKHPGGGPFWVEDKDSKISKQVVETSQVDLSEKGQKEILESATHFSPVDFICGVKDYKGKNFSLQDYSNPDTGLITTKSKDGKELKALELPGLWNGGMYYWLTVFVEVPRATFNPVKEVNDLLKPEHQPLK